jgi:hypothetical protein
VASSRTLADDDAATPEDVMAEQARIGWLRRWRERRRERLARRGDVTGRARDSRTREGQAQGRQGQPLWPK